MQRPTETQASIAFTGQHATNVTTTARLEELSLSDVTASPRLSSPVTSPTSTLHPSFTPDPTTSNLAGTTVPVTRHDEAVDPPSTHLSVTGGGGGFAMSDEGVDHSSAATLHGQSVNIQQLTEDMSYLRGMCACA